MMKFTCKHLNLKFNLLKKDFKFIKADLEDEGDGKASFWKAEIPGMENKYFIGTINFFIFFIKSVDESEVYEVFSETISRKIPDNKNIFLVYSFPSWNENKKTPVLRNTFILNKNEFKKIGDEYIVECRNYDKEVYATITTKDFKTFIPKLINGEEGFIIKSCLV